MTVSGYIQNEQGAPLGGASVELWYNNVLLERAIAGNNGVFVIRSDNSGNRVKVSHVGYQTLDESVSGTSIDDTYIMRKNVKEEEEVTVTSVIKKKSAVLLLLGALALLALLEDRR
jgi:hypothetical protein